MNSYAAASPIIQSYMIRVPLNADDNYAVNRSTGQVLSYGKSSDSTERFHV